MPASCMLHEEFHHKNLLENNFQGGIFSTRNTAFFPQEFTWSGREFHVMYELHRRRGRKLQYFGGAIWTCEGHLWSN